MKKSALPSIKCLGFTGVVLILVSCGTQKNVGYADGIYNESSSTQTQEEEKSSTSLDSEYYKNYFGETVEEVEEINDDTEVFTDIDTYSSDNQDNTTDPGSFTGNGGWGDTTENVTVNFIQKHKL